MHIIAHADSNYALTKNKLLILKLNFELNSTSVASVLNCLGLYLGPVATDGILSIVGNAIESSFEDVLKDWRSKLSYGHQAEVYSLIEEPRDLAFSMDLGCGEKRRTSVNPLTSRAIGYHVDLESGAHELMFQDHRFESLTNNTRRFFVTPRNSRN